MGLVRIAQLELGKLLWFSAGKVEDDATPDPWWLLKDLFYFVFEDHAGGKLDGRLNAGKARQAMAHPDWIRMTVPDGKSEEITSVVVTPSTRAEQGAETILYRFYVWPLEDYISWAENAVATVRTLRAKFPGTGDIIWRAEAAELLKANRLDAASIREIVFARRGDSYFSS